jgi:putative N6-adenine-specific DNA methylase
MELLIPVAAGLEQTVKRQLNILGYQKCPAENGRISVDGDWLDVARLNVLLRSGERVLVKVAQFTAVTFDELYAGMYAVNWENYLEMDSLILMDGKCQQSVLGAIKACGGVAKKAIISRLADKKKTGRRTFTESGARTIMHRMVLSVCCRMVTSLVKRVISDEVCSLSISLNEKV